MKLKSRSHVYECLPPFLNNRKLDPSDQVVIGLKVIPMNEQDMFQRQITIVQSEYARDKALELVEQKTKELVKGKVEYIRGLCIEGINDDGADLDFDTFYAEGPPELVSWVIRAVMSTTELSAAERKNFVPESATV